jgi:hypothetical protein
MSNRLISAGLFVVAFAVGCHRDKEASGPMERAGKGVDNAADKTGTALKGAAKKTGEALESAGEATGRAFDKLGTRIGGDGKAAGGAASK